MTRRPFGVLGEVSALTLGGAGLMGGWGHEPDLDEAVATIRAAVDAGIDHIDVAPAYGGDGGAERAVGAAFGGSLAAGVRISTKVPLDRPAPGTALGLIERSLTASLQRLRLPRVDLLLTHCWLLPDGEEGAGRSGLPFRDYVHEVRPALERLAADGRIGAWGISGIGAPATVQAALASRPQPAAVQAITNVLSSAGEAVPFRGPPTGSVAVAAAAAGVPVIGIRAVGRGALADVLDKQVDDDHPIAVDYRRAAGLRRLARARGIPAARLAYRYALSLPEVATVAIGVRNRAELADAVAAERDGPLDAGELAELRAECPRF